MSTKTYADVVFLVDTSQETSQASFQWMQNFISRITGILEVGKDKYRIGLAQYGDQGYTEFLFDTYKTRNEMITHILEHLVLRGGSRRTGQGLRFLNQTFFQEAAGSRFLQGVPQYAVVITSGRSEDEVRDAAQILRKRGVDVVSVGVQDSDRTELERIGSLVLVSDLQGEDGTKQLLQDVNEVIQGTWQSKIMMAPAEGTVGGKEARSMAMQGTRKSQCMKEICMPCGVVQLVECLSHMPEGLR